jgi:hypothetical protein
MSQVKATDPAPLQRADFLGALVHDAVEGRAGGNDDQGGEDLRYRGRDLVDGIREVAVVDAEEQEV